MNSFSQKSILEQNVKLDSPQKRAVEIKRRVHSLSDLFMIAPSMDTGTDFEKITFLGELKAEITLFVPEAAQEVDKAFSDWGKKTAQNNVDALLKEALEITINILAEQISLKELENRMQQKQIRDLRSEKLSRGLNFSILREELCLHVPLTFFETSKIATEAFKAGLKILAEKLIKEPELADIITITGESSLVREKHLFWKSLGFEIDSDEKGKPINQVAKMSREKLLELYGQ